MVNILLRTSYRPNGFIRMLDCIKQNKSDYNLIVSVDNDFSENYVRDAGIKNIIRFEKVKRNGKYHNPYNLYLNSMVDMCETGWIFIVDDDDLITHDAIESINNICIDDQTIYLFKAELPKKIIPILNDDLTCDFSMVAMPNIISHTNLKNRSKFKDVRGGDYIFYNEHLSKGTNIVVVDKIIYKVDSPNGLGDRFDIESFPLYTYIENKNVVIAELYQHGMREHFKEVRISIIDKLSSSLLDDCVIVLGYNMLNIKDIKTRFNDKRIIIYQLEPLSCIKDNVELKSYTDVLSLADCIWEYDESNISKYEHLGIKTIHLPIPYSNNLCKLEHTKKDIDVLIYGAPDTRRYAVIKELYDYLRTTIIVDAVNIWGQQLCDLVSRSKVVLNIHRQEDFNIQEQVRMIPLVMNNVCVLSEKSINNYMGNSIIEVPIKKIPPAIQQLIYDDRWKYYADKSKDDFLKYRKTLEDK